MENEYKTLAIGTIFTYNGKTYKVKPSGINR